MNKQRFDKGAIACDVPRSFKQYVARKLAKGFVGVCNLNGGGFWSTEVVQQIQPVYRLGTSFGDIFVRGGHGRVRWRVRTFYTEEPMTVQWLETIHSDDVFWDVGANIGLYSLYVAKRVGCHVLAVEPEAQNYADLVDNIALNGLQGVVDATCIPICGGLGMGRLMVHGVTRGGAYHQFSKELNNNSGDICQLQIGVSLCDLVDRFNLPFPSYVKIDVDGIEPEIIMGGGKVLKQCKSVLVELQPEKDIRHERAVNHLENLGFSCIGSCSNWDSRVDKSRRCEYPTVNMVFAKKDLFRRCQFCKHLLVAGMYDCKCGVTDQLVSNSEVWDGVDCDCFENEKQIKIGDGC